MVWDVFNREESHKVLQPVSFGLSLPSDTSQLGLSSQGHSKQDAHCGGNWIAGEGYLGLIFLGEIALTLVYY